MFDVILASKSKVRKEILNNNNINCEVIPSNIDEDIFKESLIKEKASPERKCISFSGFIFAGVHDVVKSSRSPVQRTQNQCL